MTRPSVLLRAEGLAVGAAGVGAYVMRDASFLLFVAVILLPDLSIAPYLVNPRIGSVAYNAVHTYVAPLVVVGAGVATGTPLAVDVGLIWAIHVGGDRLFGLGLKYADSDFGDTHLQRV